MDKYFVIFGYDGTDSEAPARRADAREAHLESVKPLKAAGIYKYAGPLLDDEGNIKASMMVLKYPSEEVIRTEFLPNEPYYTQGVWQRIEIVPHKPADAFL